jgi:hypothetical protein
VPSLFSFEFYSSPSYWLIHFPDFHKTKLVAACPFSKELCANPRNSSTNRMKGITLSCLQKSFVNSKAFGVKRLRTY